MQAEPSVNVAFVLVVQSRVAATLNFAWLKFCLAVGEMLQGKSLSLLQFMRDWPYKPPSSNLCSSLWLLFTPSFWSSPSWESCYDRKILNPFLHHTLIWITKETVWTENYPKPSVTAINTIITSDNAICHVRICTWQTDHFQIQQHKTLRAMGCITSLFL